MIAAEDVRNRIHAAGLRLHLYPKTFDLQQLVKARGNVADALAMLDVMLDEEWKRQLRVRAER